MNINKICQTKVIVIEESSTAKEAVDLMEAAKIGALLVVSSDNIPSGIITDRDIALKIVGQNRSSETAVKEIMSTNLLTIRPSQSVDEVLSQMQDKAVRRAPVIDEHNEIIGFISMDDILIYLAEKIGDLASLVKIQLLG